MANHKSAIKRIRSNNRKRVHNRFYHKSSRTKIKQFRSLTDKKEAEEQFPAVVSMIDKLAKRNIIHKNKASNLKSSLSKHVKELS